MTSQTSNSFPLPKTDVLSLYIKSGIMLAPCVGTTTIPARKRFQLTPFDPSFTPKAENYQAILQHRYVVIDVDPRSYKTLESGEKDKPLSRLFYDLGLNMEKTIQNTFVVRTPSGGYHIYFTKLETFKIKQNLKGYPGLEFKDRWITAAGSYRRMPKKKDGYYTIHKNNPSLVVPCPEALLALLIREDDVNIEVEGLVSDHPAMVKKFICYCKETEPAIEGANGDSRTFHVAAIGKNWGLKASTTAELMLEHFNPRCRPTWSETDVRSKVENAYAYGYMPIGAQSVDQDFDALPQQVDEEKLKWHIGANDTLKKTRNNLMNLLFKVNNAPCKNMVRYNEFNHEIELIKKPVWHKDNSVWGDSDAIQAACWLSMNKGYEVPTNIIHEVILHEARTRAYHPIRDYLSALKPISEHNLLDTWLNRYCGTPINKYTSFVGRKILVAAVARVFNPGCKFDHILVLEGHQGLGKSHLCQTLAEPWYSDASLDIRDKDSVSILQGNWIVELAEMAVLGKPGIENLKAFITRQVDRIRPAYGRTVENFKRQCIFFGTINPEKQGYLKDPTGNRRFWPVALKHFDLHKLREERDELWAQAVAAFKKGENIYVEGRETAAMIDAEVIKRQQEDPWFELLETYIEGHYMEHCPEGSEYCVVLPAQLYEDALNGSAAKITTWDASRIANILVRLGFEKTGSSKQNKRSSEYIRLFESFL